MAEGNFQGRMELEDIPSIWRMGVKALKMRRSLRKSPHPPRGESPLATAGSG